MADHSQSSLSEVGAENAASVLLLVTEDGKSAYNTWLETDDFKFTPENINQNNVLGEGHAHLYVYGVKVARLYGPDFHYDGDFEGSNTFKVTLNANDHSEYAVNGAVISSEVTVTHDSNDESHDDSHMEFESHMDSTENN